jgi:hypothetical protein
VTGVQTCALPICLSILAKILGVFANINVARLSTRLDDSWRLVQDRQIPIFGELISALQTNLTGLTAANSKTAETEKANLLFRTIYTGSTQFLKALESPDFLGLVKTEALITDAFVQLSGCINEMTDAVLLIYDPDTANKLPARFTVPPTPSDAVLPQAAAMAVLSRITALEQKQQSFRERVLTPMPNLSLIALVQPFFDEITNLLLDTLRLSIMSESVSHQLALTNGAIGIAKAADLINRGVKAKCLANPTWAAGCERGLDELATSLPIVHELADAARQLAEEEEAKNSETRGKIFAVLTPIRDMLPQLEGAQKTLAMREVSAAREFSVLLLKLANSAATLMGRLLLHVKDQHREGDALESTLALGRTLLGRLQVIRETVLARPTPGALLDLLPSLSGVLEKFGGEANTATPEGQDLRQQANGIIEGTAALQATIKRAIEQPAPAPKAKAAPKSGSESTKRAAAQPVSIINTAAGQDKLIQRLNLEARVNMWRWRLEFTEKQLAALGA